MTKLSSAFFESKNINYRESIVEDKCNQCIHDYHGKPEVSGILVFLKHLFTEKFYWLNYYFKARFA